MNEEKLSGDITEFYDFNPDDDIIIPSSFLGEIYFIYCIIKSIITNKKDRKTEYIKLKRQIKFYNMWIAKTR